jgi:muconolactone delta-isomerase
MRSHLFLLADAACHAGDCSEIDPRQSKAVCMLFLVTNTEPRPHGSWHTPERHSGCLDHWVTQHLQKKAIIYPVMFVRGYAMYIEVNSGRQMREMLEGNPMWPDETYRIYMLEENDVMSELPVEPGKQRFLILARPAKPLPPTLDYAGTERMLEDIKKRYGAIVHRLVEDVAGYAILVSVESNDQLREILEPLPITTFVNYQIMPLGTLSGHQKHIRDLGLNDPFKK